MSADSTSRPRPIGQTTGGPLRPPQQVAGPALTFDLAEEASRLRAEEAWHQGTNNAKTLVKEPDFRIVLIVVKRGARLQEHRASGRISVQTLSGHVRLHLPDHAVDLPAGRLLALEPGIAHDVEALEESAFLLTIAWPAGAEG